MINAAKLISRPSAVVRPVPIVQNYNGGKPPEFSKGMRLRVMFLTPAKAAKILLTHTNFRTLDEKKAEQYAAVMARGEWGIFPPICLGQGGCVQDGQHRLRGIVLSGIGQWIAVVSGIPGTAARHYDNGRPRCPRDLLRYDFGSALRTAPKRLQSVILLTRYGAEKPGSLLNCDYSRLYELYKPAIARFSGIFHKSRRHCPPVLVAAFCRAWLRLSGDDVQRDALTEAAMKYARMEFNLERLNPLRLLCAWFCEANPRSTTARSDAYRRSAQAIRSYLKRKTLKRLVPAKLDPFPLPDIQ